MDGSDKILIEVMYKADYCLPCLYMDQAVREILPKYEQQVVYRRVEFMKAGGKKRFLGLSCYRNSLPGPTEGHLFAWIELLLLLVRMTR